MATKETKEKEEVIEMSNPYDEKMVEIELFKDGDKYSNDVFVGRNGETYQIKRGVKIKVPEGIALILKNQEDMDQLAAARREAAQRASK